MSGVTPASRRGGNGTGAYSAWGWRWCVWALAPAAASEALAAEVGAAAGERWLPLEPAASEIRLLLRLRSPRRRISNSLLGSMLRSILAEISLLLLFRVAVPTLLLFCCVCLS